MLSVLFSEYFKCIYISSDYFQLKAGDFSFVICTCIRNTMQVVCGKQRNIDLFHVRY